MDFSKALDKVSHRHPVAKLRNYGICGKTSEWIKCFLEGHTQSRILDAEVSDSVSVLSGVPQGSVLGPCLFIFYINDLPDSLSSNVRLFADDTIVYLTIQSDTDSQVFQKDLDKLANWEMLWKINFNPNKC